MEHPIHPILLELQNNSEQLFGFKLYSSEPVSLGWLNLKWKLVTDRGELLLKIYHMKRFSNADVLSRALQQQRGLYQAGFPCPDLLTRNGQVLHSFNDEKYNLMQFCTGSIVKPAYMNKKQMIDLGTTTGKMHRILNESSYSSETKPQFIPQRRDERLAHWRKVMDDAINNEKYSYISQIEQQLKLSETIDIDSLSSGRTGWAHRDLWGDNLLFYNDRVSAVLDFDRLNFDYLEIDIARAIMSWAFYDGRLCTELASAFLEGYRHENSFESGRLVHSLRLLWYLESVWWINSNMDHHNRVQARFAEEMIWLAQNNDQLQEAVGGL
jgi:homoserine kinase type II